MPAIPLDDRNDSPLFLVMNAVAIGAGATAYSQSVGCAGFDAALVLYTIDEIHDRELQLSDDDATWYDLNSGGRTVSGLSAGNVNGGNNRALQAPLSGARFVRLKLKNVGVAAATATAKIQLGRAGASW